MSEINKIFDNIHKLIHESQHEFLSTKEIHPTNETFNSSTYFESLTAFLKNIFKEIDSLLVILKDDKTLLISIKNQKLLRSCYQLVCGLGYSCSLIPGLGINLSKRCSMGQIIQNHHLSDEQKYSLLTECTDFFIRSYEIPIPKSIIITFQLSDYLAALIQLSFAPLKKPGIYKDFIMTEELYKQLTLSKEKYVQVYEDLVSNCFQPMVMKEFLVLQGVTDPPPPSFARRIISKELSLRLLAQGGLVSLIRCFIESYAMDSGFEWKKIDMICKIVITKHGSGTEDQYLNNICAQLKDALKLNNTHYLTAALTCLLSLNEKYPQNQTVTSLVKEVFLVFDTNEMTMKSEMPGTIILTPEEIKHNIDILHVCVSSIKMEWPVHILSKNIYVLFMLGVKCTKSHETKAKVTDIIVKYFECLKENEITTTLQSLIFGKDSKIKIAIDEYDAGLMIKSSNVSMEHPVKVAVSYILDIFNASSENKVVENIFQSLLQMLIEMSMKRHEKRNSEEMLEVDVKYGVVLEILSEIASSVKITAALKNKPSLVLPFIENFILKSELDQENECLTISLVLLNTILSTSNIIRDIEDRLHNLVPILKNIAKDNTNLNSILCEEALSYLSSSDVKKTQETPFAKAMADVFDDLLPVRTHGLIELTKLIDSKDPETICKKHYIFCIFQEHLKHADSYVYLSAINGIAALGTHCTEDVLQVLCKEFLNISSAGDLAQTNDELNKATELRMKVGDITVKVTRNLGEMAVVYKTLLLNTMLCGCRDEDPFIRTSALSNLAEIALVLNYKIGAIIYEILLCIWSIIESDKAVECRRAAVMVIRSLLKGLGKETLIQLKENILPIYRTLKKLYRDSDEDSIVRLQSQLALEELNATVSEFLFPELKMEKQIFLLDQ